MMIMVMLMNPLNKTMKLFVTVINTLSQFLLATILLFVATALHSTVAIIFRLVLIKIINF